MTKIIGTILIIQIIALKITVDMIYTSRQDAVKQCGMMVLDSQVASTRMILSLLGRIESLEAKK